MPESNPVIPEVPAGMGKLVKAEQKSPEKDKSAAPSPSATCQDPVVLMLLNMHI